VIFHFFIRHAISTSSFLDFHEKCCNRKTNNLTVVLIVVVYLFRMIHPFGQENSAFLKDPNCLLSPVIGHWNDRVQLWVDNVTECGIYIGEMMEFADEVPLICSIRVTAA
jgi:hypothetical protein